MYARVFTSSERMSLRPFLSKALMHLFIHAFIHLFTHFLSILLTLTNKNSFQKSGNKYSIL